jgi:hypothetical protein
MPAPALHVEKPPWRRATAITSQRTTARTSSSLPPPANTTKDVSLQIDRRKHAGALKP